MQNTSLAPYYGPTPSPQQLGTSGNPLQAYAQAQLDAERLHAGGINTDFAPLADVYQGGAIDQSRMFGTTPDRVITCTGAFLDGLQQYGVIDTLKHWPGLGAEMMGFQIDRNSMRLEHLLQGISDLLADVFLHAETPGKQAHEPGQLGNADDVFVGNVAHVSIPVKR